MESEAKTSEAKPEKKTESPSDQFSAFLKRLKLPQVDVNQLMASQRKNMEAFAKATETAMKGAGAVGRRQAEILQDAFAHAAKLIREQKFTGSPQEIVAKQTELVRKTFETAVARARELGEMVDKANKKAFEIVKRRMNESFDEISETLKKKEQK